MDLPTAVQSARGSTQGLPLGVAIARAHQLADTDPEAALTELESLRAANPRNPAVVAEFARVLKKLERNEEAVQAAANAIRLALSGGAGPIAHDVFRNFASEAAQLNLEPAIYEQLGRILTARREWDGASWCYRAAAALGGDPKSLQKGLIAVAEAAMEHGQFERAAGVYQSFARTWPESPLTRFANDGADEALRRAQLAGTAR
jgi:tetratricopeptide (TPR) repeat protein